MSDLKVGGIPMCLNDVPKCSEFVERVVNYPGVVAKYRFAPRYRVWMLFSIRTFSVSSKIN